MGAPVAAKPAIIEADSDKKIVRASTD